MEKRPTKEQLATFKRNANDQSFSAEVRAKFQAVVDKFENVGEEVVDAVEGKKERKPRTPKATTQRKPRATTKQTADDIEKAKAEIKSRTGKTEEECEKIIDEYRSLRTKSQERKKKEAEASKTNVARINKLKKDDKVIEGTNEKTADAVIETTTKDVAEKIEKQIEAVEEKAETEAKKEVEKQMPKVSATEKKQAVKEKVEEKVKEKTKTIVKRVVIDTSALLSSIAESLGKFDKDSQKEFLIKLRSDIDKLISKYSFGGLTDGGVQVMNIQQSNLSSSSVNPTMFGGGGGIYSSDELYIVKVFDLNGNLLDSSKRVWARNLSKAKEIAIDDFEYDMQQKYGSDLRFQVEVAPSMMSNGGGVKGKKSRILEDFFIGKHPYDEFIIEQFRKDGTRMEFSQYNIGRTAQSERKLPYRLMIGLDLERKLINDTLEKNAEFEVTSNKNGVKVLKIKYPSGVYRTAKLVEGERYDFDKGVGVKYSDGGGVGSMSKEDALKKAMEMGVDFEKDFHAQSYGNELSELAKKVGYRKSPSSSGSLGRAFFYHLQKIYDKKKYENGGGVSSDQRRKGYVHGYKFDNPNDRETFTNYLEREDIDYYTRNGVVATKMAISNKELRKIGINQEFSEFGRGGLLGESAKLEYIDDAFASYELQEKLREKLGLDSDANSVGDNVVISFAYTDYGGDFLDKVAIEYFKENYPENTLFEYAGYGGENAFVFGEPAQEWINSTEDYPLGFEGIEEFYYQMQNDAEFEGFEYFVDDLSRDYTFDKEEVMSWLMENKGGYYSVYPSGVDFSYGDLTDELLEEGLIKKEEMKRGGNVNTGRSWKLDRARHNKRENYEVPVSSRKKAHGGTIEERMRMRRGM
jgi:hypothetical protein